MDVAARWSEVVGRPEADIPLDEAALLISAAANPGMVVEEQLGILDDLGGRVERPTSRAACRLLFDELGVSGDRATYDDPRNSYLDQVLRRRLGIPISLSVLLIEVARRAGVPLEPVGLPGHFMVRDPAHPGELIDAFAGGQCLDRAGAERLLSALAGGAVTLTPSMLAPVGTRAVLARMLANLDRSFEQRRQRAGLAWVSDLRARLPGASPGDRSQLAGRLAAMGRFDAAASALEDAARGVPDGRARDRLLASARALRAQLN